MALWKRGKVLGRGGFGLVSLASTASDQPLIDGIRLPSSSFIAVKSCTLSESLSLQQEHAFLRLFRESAQIIQCYRVDISHEDNDVLYNLLLEYASGGSLADRLCGKGMPEFDVRMHTKNVLLGLSQVHAKGIVHCDIKPHNILLVDGVAKIADFGLAMTLQQCRGKNLGLRGTSIYLAPESVVNEQYGTAVDIWALGSTVYEMITGTPLWGSDEDTENDVFNRIAYEEPDFQNAKLSEEARDFLKRCLGKNPSERWSANMLLGHPFVRLKLKLKIPISQKMKQRNVIVLRRPHQKTAFKTQPPIRELIIIDP